MTPVITTSIPPAPTAGMSTTTESAGKPNWTFVIGLAVVFVALVVGNTIVVIRRNRRALRRSAAQTDIEAHAQADHAVETASRGWLPPTPSEVMSNSVRLTGDLPLPAVHMKVTSSSRLRDSVLGRAISKLPFPDAGKLKDPATDQDEKAAQNYHVDIEATADVLDRTTTAGLQSIVPPPAQELSAVDSVASIYSQDSDGADDLIVYPSSVDSCDPVPELDTPTPSSPSSDVDSVLLTPTVDVWRPLQQPGTSSTSVGTATQVVGEKPAQPAPTQSTSKTKATASSGASETLQDEPEERSSLMVFRNGRWRLDPAAVLEELSRLSTYPSWESLTSTPSDKDFAASFESSLSWTPDPDDDPDAIFKWG